jgi:ketosteroid isomerase-like protein
LSTLLTLFAPFIAVFACFATFAQTADTAAAQRIATLDREYSNLSIDKGMPAASLAYFAEDGVAFAPTAVNGKKYWGSRKDFPGVLIWQPVFAITSRAGDLGFTTGPWELKSKTDQTSLGYGSYVTVWGKQAAEDWKILLDVGIENPQPTEAPGPLQVLPPDATAGARPVDIARPSLQKTQRRFLEASRKDSGKAVIDFASDEVRIYRDKAGPAIGKLAAQVMLGSQHGQLKSEFGGSKLSRSGDLAYFYGKYSEERTNTQLKGISLTIWRTDLNGDWKIVLDLQKELAKDS